MSKRPTKDHPAWTVPDHVLAEIAAGLGATPDRIRCNIAEAVDAGYLRIVVTNGFVTLEGTFPGDVCP